MEYLFKKIESGKNITSKYYDALEEHIKDLEKEKDSIGEIIDNLDIVESEMSEINVAIHECIDLLRWFHIFPGDKTINEEGIDQIEKVIDILKRIRYFKKEKKDIPPELLGKEKKDEKKKGKQK